MNILIVTWQGGGVVQPAMGLGRRLAERGHDVRILAPTTLAARVSAAACRFEPWPAELEFDPSRGRAFEDQWDRFYQEVLIGPGLADAVRAVVEAEAPDIVLVDYMLRSATFAIERAGLPAALLMHMSYRQHGRHGDGDPDAEWGWRWQYDQLNRARASMGLSPLRIGPDNPSVAIAARSRAAIVVMPREFDDWPDPPATVTFVGPIFEEPTAGQPSRPAWESPWPSDDSRPLIVVTFGSTYMHQEDLLGRVCGALSGLDVRLLLLTGSELRPDEVPGLSDGVEVREYVPHSAVLPAAALVITHGGMGTLMAAFAAGVPTVCIPLGRDQHVNAERAAELGTSTTLSPDAGPAEIAEVVGSALRSAQMREAARRMQVAIERYGEGRLAVEAIERVAREAPSGALSRAAT